MVKYCHQSRGLTYVLVPESSSSKEQLEPTDNIINNTEKNVDYFQDFDSNTYSEKLKFI